jgi:hypothetical protein
MILAAVILIAMLSLLGWTQTGELLRLPSMQPYFGDMRVVQGALASLAQGYDPQINNPGDPVNRAMNYPAIWIPIAQGLGLNHETNFVIFLSVLISAYFLICVWISYRSNSFWIPALFCSFSSLLLMERGNNDLVIFILLTLALVWTPNLIGSAIVALAAALKIYPAFALVAFTRTRWQIVASVFFGLIAATTFFEQIATVRQATPVSGSLSYGMLSLMSLFRLSDPLSMAIGNALIVTVAFFFTQKIQLSETNAVNENLFIASASLYVGSFFFGSNFDYRLAFLILAIPYLVAQSRAFLHLGLPIMFMIACNQNLFRVAFGKVGLVANVAVKLAIAVILLSMLISILSIRLRVLVLRGKVFGTGDRQS